MRVRPRVAARSKALCAGLFLAVATLAACSGETGIGPENEPEVTNAPDSFQWQVSDLSGVTQTLSYGWSNAGTSADVDQSSSLRSGEATIEISDDRGTLVFQEDLDRTGSFTTAQGQPGEWTIRVTLRDASGTLNFRVQRP